MLFRRIALTALLLAGFTTSHAFAANTKQCRDEKGKFTKCQTMPAKPKKCRDAKGRFMSCSKQDMKNMEASNNDQAKMPLPPHPDMKSDMKKPPMKAPTEAPSATTNLAQ